MNTLRCISVFAVGVALGVASTYSYFKSKYEADVEADVRSVKEELLKYRSINDFNNDSNDDIETKDEDDDNSDEVLKYIKQRDDIIYNNFYNKHEEANPGIMEGDPNIVVVSPGEFLDNVEDYPTETLYFFSDGVLTDDYGDPVDIVSYVGDQALSTFGDYEDDTVYVRNDSLQTYYEILKKEQTYDENYL